jgi:hypothetical protein
MAALLAPAATGWSQRPRATLGVFRCFIAAYRTDRYGTLVTHSRIIQPMPRGQAYDSELIISVLFSLKEILQFVSSNHG